MFCKLYVCFHPILEDFWAKSYLDPVFSHSGQSSVHKSTRGHPRHDPVLCNGRISAHLLEEMGFVTTQPCNTAFAMSLPGLSTAARQSISACTCPALPAALSCLLRPGQRFLQPSRRPCPICFTFAFLWYNHSFIEPAVARCDSVRNEVFMTVTQRCNAEKHKLVWEQGLEKRGHGTRCRGGQARGGERWAGTATAMNSSPTVH